MSKVRQKIKEIVETQPHRCNNVSTKEWVHILSEEGIKTTSATVLKHLKSLVEEGVYGPEGEEYIHSDEGDYQDRTSIGHKYWWFYT